jgi:hypothetical protein
MEPPITPRNRLYDFSVSDLLNALRSKDESFLDEVRDVLSLPPLISDIVIVRLSFRPLLNDI